LNDSNKAVPLGFVDANILADAILGQNMVDEKIVQGRRERRTTLEIWNEIESAFKTYEPARLAYQFFLMLRGSNTPRHFVLSSNLALLEATNVITNKGKAKIRLSDDYRAQISAGIYLFRKSVGHTLVIQDEYDFGIANSLVTQFACNASDAVLVATALRNGCSRFISRDNRLKRKLRRFKEVQITSTQTVFNDLGVKLSGPDNSTKLAKIPDNVILPLVAMRNRRDATDKITQADLRNQYDMEYLQASDNILRAYGYPNTRQTWQQLDQSVSNMIQKLRIMQASVERRPD